MCVTKEVSCVKNMCHAWQQTRFKNSRHLCHTWSGLYTARGEEGIEHLRFAAYDNGGLLLDSVTLTNTVPQVWETISLSADGVTRVEYSSINDDFGLDNMRFVPEPATLALLALGGFAARHRRR